MDTATRLLLSQLATTLVLPGAVTLGIVLGARKLRPAEGDRAGLAGLALGLGLLTSFVAIRGVPPLPPADSLDWIPFLLAATLALGLLADGLRARIGLWGATELWWLPTVAGFVLLMRPIFESLEGLEGPLHLLGAAALARGVFGFAVGAAQRVAPAAMYGALSLGALTGAGAIGLTGSAALGQLLAGVAAVHGLMAILSWRWPQLRPGAGAVGAGLAGFLGLLLYGHHYVETSAWALGLAALVPLGAWAAIKAEVRWKALALALGVGLVPAGLALWFATHPPGKEAPSEGGGAGDGSSADPYEMYNPNK